MNMTTIATKWVFRNKLDENGVVSRNKARLVAQGYNQQEGIDYDETYALVARLESIRILLAYACALDFKLFQMDVKSAFLNGFINEEVYVAQPSGFIDFKKPYHLYKLKKALYGLKQAPKAWKQTVLLYPYAKAEVVSSVAACQQAPMVNQALSTTRFQLETSSDPLSEQYNLAYFIAKRMELVTKQPRLIMPYSMLLTRLFKHVMTISHGVLDDYYDLHDHVMYPLTAQQEQKTRKYYGTKRGRHSTSSSSAFGQPSSSHLNDDNDDDDENVKGTSRTSTSSPTHFVNSLINEVPRVFENPPNINPDMEPFYTLQTEILNRQVQLRYEHHGGLRSIGKGIKTCGEI
ncbi:retrovirus-related pol polyprotein from transposon TNT 1-94 [Tanacetum coccineum]